MSKKKNQFKNGSCFGSGLTEIARLTQHKEKKGDKKQSDTQVTCAQAAALTYQRRRLGAEGHVGSVVLSFDQV